MSARYCLPLLATLAGCTTVPVALPDPGPARMAWIGACEDSYAMTEWDKPAPPFRVFGQTYYVGTCGITSLLIVRPEGMTLIDSGTDKGAEVVISNIRSLGFDPRKVDTIVMSHEHFDHIGGMARLQAATGAVIHASTPAVAVLRSGLPSPEDPQAHSDHPAFPAVKGAVRVLPAGQAHAGHEPSLHAIPTPGHTVGALSWTWQECEEGDCRTIVYVDSMNPISSDDYRFSDHPDLVAAFRAGIAAIDAAPCDIVLAPHPGGVAMRQRLLGERPLVDPSGCKAYAASVRDRLDARLAKEAAGG